MQSVKRLQISVVKRTAMEKRLWFFFAMFSASASCSSVRMPIFKPAKACGLY